MRNTKLLWLAGLVAVLATLVVVVPALAAVIDETTAQGVASHPTRELPGRIRFRRASGICGPSKPALPRRSHRRGREGRRY